MTSAPPVNSLAESPSPANIAAVAAPKTTSVINKIPRRAGASRMAAHMRAAIERTHHKPPVKSTVIATANRSLVAIVEKGSRNSALAREVKVAPKANRNAEGIFLFSTTTILDALAAHAPEVLAATRAAFDAAEKDLGFTRLAPAPWSDLPDISIDYAVMERAPNLTVVPYAGAWSDLGDWQAVWREAEADASGTVTAGHASALDCHNTLLQATSEAQQLVGIGLKDIIAVAMPDAVLVAHKDRAQEVKQAVAALKAKAAPQAETLPRDYRPWGWYESLVVGPRFQVKRIVVHPGAALSLQSHHHRAEHWIVVEGTAKVTVDTEVKLVTENQSVYIPLGAVHRMENPGKVPLTLIEVQTGSYLGEDDIIRYEDVYARGQGAKG